MISPGIHSYQENSQRPAGRGSDRFQSWVQGLGKVFSRVALFEVDGIQARVVAVLGIADQTKGRTISLVDQTPLRWAVEAASPIVGAGRAPGGQKLPKALSLSAPRAYAVIPLLVNDQIKALAYADNSNRALVLGSVGEIFAYCDNLLNPARGQQRRVVKPSARKVRSSSRRPQTGRRKKIRFVHRQPKDLDFEPHSAGGEGIESIAAMIQGALHSLPSEDETHLTPEAPTLEVQSQAIEDGPAVAPSFSVDDLAAQVAAETMDFESEFGPALDSGAVEHWQDEGIDVEDDAMGMAEMPESLALTTPEPIAEEDEDDTLVDISPAALAPQSNLAAARVPAWDPYSALDSVRFEDFFELPAFRQAYVPSPQKTEAITRAESIEFIVTPQGLAPRGSTGARRAWKFPWAKFMATVAAVLVFGIAGAFLLLRPLNGDGHAVVTIPVHSTVNEIGHLLAERHVIRSPKAFSALVRMVGIEHVLKAGVYRLPRGAWPWAVMTELEKGQVRTQRITIPEGLSLKQWAAHLEGQGVGKAAELLAAARDPKILSAYGIKAESAEGFLFPETYRIAEGLSPTDVVGVMLDEFFARYRFLGGDRDDADALMRRVILASIVEREAAHPAEQKRIAGVFYNRLREDMRLESCATVQYLLDKPKERLRLADLQVESPYNTYLNEGLPPGPIASPGERALAAAMSPESHSYQFFVAREDGSKRHIFSRTFEEHEAARKRVARRRVAH